MFFRQKVLSSKGFSLLELLSAASIAAVLSVVGIKSYQSQVNKAKTAEAQESLSYIYSTQQVFYNNWNTYHENLMVVGAIPSGIYNYDVGFTNAGHATGGDLANYPSGYQKVLTVKGCSTFDRICKGSCLAGIRRATRTYSSYFSSPNCEVIGRQKILDSRGNRCSRCPVAWAGPLRGKPYFIAIAVEKFKDQDIWSIDSKQKVVHVEDGT